MQTSGNENLPTSLTTTYSIYHELYPNSFFSHDLLPNSCNRGVNSVSRNGRHETHFLSNNLDFQTKRIGLPVQNCRASTGRKCVMDGQRQTRWESTIGQEDGSIERLEDVDLIRSNGAEIQTICPCLKLEISLSVFFLTILIRRDECVSLFLIDTKIQPLYYSLHPAVNERQPFRKLFVFPGSSWIF